MAPRGDTYSRIIGWLKLLLPLAALVMLSTLFLLPRSNDLVNKMPYADSLSGKERMQEQVNAPYYAGMTPRGDALTMSARSARPVDGDLGTLAAQGLQATMNLSDGSRITLTSDGAILSEGDKDALLEGGVHIESSTGYTIDTERMRTAIDRVDAETLDPVSGSGPAGKITAGKLTITPTGDGTDVQLLFTGGVKLIYDPQN